MSKPKPSENHIMQRIYEQPKFTLKQLGFLWLKPDKLNFSYSYEDINDCLEVVKSTSSLILSLEGDIDMSTFN